MPRQGGESLYYTDLGLGEILKWEDGDMDWRDREKHRSCRQEICDLLVKHGSKAPVERDFSRRLDQKPCIRNVRDWQRLLVERDFAIRIVSKEYGSFGMEPDIFKSQIIADLVGLYFWYKHLGFDCDRLARPEQLRAGSIKNMWGQTSPL